jgi:hypothetical protein
MVKKGYTPEQVINKLREAEVLLGQGATDAGVRLMGKSVEDWNARDIPRWARL